MTARLCLPAGGRKTGANSPFLSTDAGIVPVRAGTYRELSRLSRAKANFRHWATMAQSGALARWRGIQHASAVTKGKDAPVSMKLRVTEIFRKDDGAWKLIRSRRDRRRQRQADTTLVAGPTEFRHFRLCARHGLSKALASTWIGLPWIFSPSFFSSPPACSPA